MEHLLSEVIRLNNIQIPPLQRLVGHGSEAIVGFPIRVTDDAFSLWEKLRGIRRTTGYFPVFIGKEEDVILLNSRIDYSAPNEIHRTIKRSLSFDLEAWLETNALSVIRDLFSFDGYPEKMSGFTNMPLFGVRQSIVYLGFIPRPEGFYAPAYLRFGGWNDCPPTHAHCAMLRRWNRLFGADVLSITRNEICLSVQNPPNNKFIAQSIRDELFLFCPDYPSDGILREMGYFDEILNARFWFFEWLYPWNNDIMAELPPIYRMDDEGNFRFIFSN